METDDRTGDAIIREFESIDGRLYEVVRDHVSPRVYLAGQALAGLLAAHGPLTGKFHGAETNARWAVEAADALLAELNKPKAKVG